MNNQKDMLVSDEAKWYKARCGVCNATWKAQIENGAEAISAGTFCPDCRAQGRMAPGVLNWEAADAPKETNDETIAKLRSERDELVGALREARYRLSDLRHHGVEYPETGERHQADPGKAMECIVMADSILSKHKPE